MSRIAIHLVTGGRPALLDDVLAADSGSGREPVVVALNDAVLDPERMGLPAGARVLLLADDCRRRGLPVPDDAVDYDALVDLLASAERVVSW